MNKQEIAELLADATGTERFAGLNNGRDSSHNAANIRYLAGGVVALEQRVNALARLVEALIEPVFRSE